MFGIPYEKATFHSALNPSEICLRLGLVTSRASWNGWAPKEKDFVGTVHPNGFRIYRNIRNRNTYLPLLTGKISENKTGSQVDVVITLHPIAIVIMVALFLFALRVLFIPGSDPGANFVPVSMLVLFHLGMCIFGFNPEVSHATTLLREILTTK